MAYIVYNADTLNELAAAEMTADALKNAGIKSVEGLGGESIPVNSDGFLVDPAGHLPSGVLDKIKNAWNAADGNVNTFYETSIDGTPVKDILAKCPSQQSYGIAKELGLPNGTNVPCQEFTDSKYNAIKYESGSAGATGAATGTAGTSEPAGPPAADGADAGAGDTGAGDTGAGDAAGTGDPAAGGDPSGATGSTDPGAGTSDWWKFFGSKEVLIGAVAVAGVLAIIKALGNTIKARFRKCAKVLYNMQKDFGTKENGMDMKAVLPGVGSRITDWVTRLWGAKKGRGKDKGALGLRPFVDNYRNELAADYQEARKALNMIAAQGKGIDAKSKEEQTTGKMNNYKKESQEVVYSSFSEMLKSEPLNEGENQLNEALGVAALVSLGTLAIRGGMYLFSKKDKNGNDIGEAKPVQVTPQSTREICYSILNMFFSKYFDLSAVSKKMGMDIDSLGDIDKSNVDKFAKIAQAMKQEQASGKNSKMYMRVEKNYTKMVEAYVRIANTVVNNFEKFTKNRKDISGNVKQLSEKDSNLLVASAEKLKAEVNRQKDMYENNFFRVVNAIITSPEYTTYLDFIIKDVIPVFKTGLASDADYVLDVVPKAGEYYIIHQSNQRTELADGDTAKENVVLAKVLEFDQSGENAGNPLIKFTRVALLKDPGMLNRNSKNEYDMSGYSEDNLDRTAFGKAKGQDAEQAEDSVSLVYNKWMALDPIIAINVPGETDATHQTKSVQKVYVREVPVTDPSTGQETNTEEYLIILPNGGNETKSIEYKEDTSLNEDGEENNVAEPQQENNSAENAVVKNLLFVSGQNKKHITITADDTKESDFDTFVKQENEDKLKSMGFKEATEEQKNKVAANIKELSQNAEETQVDNTEAIPSIINAKQETGTQSENEIGADVILKNIDTISNNIAQQLSTIKPEDFNITQVPGGNKATYKNGKAQLTNIVNKQRPFDAVLPFETGASTKTGKKIYVAAQPRLGAENKLYADLILVSGDGTSFDEIKFRGENNDAYLQFALPADANTVKTEITKLVNYYKANPGKYTIEESDITVEYDKYFNIAESFMSSFGFNGANQLHVNRTIKTPKSKLTYYALSENAWGDGSKLNPQKYLEESLDNILKKNSTYDDFAKLAKSSHTINLVKIAEDCSYNTAFPYNRYQMLTAANPLYEGLVIVRFDESGNLAEAIRLGVKKIYCETV